MSKCRVYDCECINERYCNEHDACCAGDPDCKPESDAVKLARDCVDRGVVGMLDRVDILARAVLDQDEQLRNAEIVLQQQMRIRDEEIAALKAALREVTDGLRLCAIERERLKAALREALDRLEASPSASRMLPQGDAVRSRIAEMRRLL